MYRYFTSHREQFLRELAVNVEQNSYQVLMEFCLAHENSEFIQLEFETLYFRVSQFVRSKNVAKWHMNFGILGNCLGISRLGTIALSWLLLLPKFTSKWIIRKIDFICFVPLRVPQSCPIVCRELVRAIGTPSKRPLSNPHTKLAKIPIIARGPLWRPFIRIDEFSVKIWRVSRT